jgi:branched-subunit amino acid ABC-type transport system permease component
MTIGGFVAIYVNRHFGMGLLPMLLLGAVVAGTIGLVAEQLTLGPLRAAGALTAAIGSIALNLVLENILRFMFGNDLQGFDLPIRPDMRIGGIRVGSQQLQNLAISVAMMAAIFAFLRFSRYGRGMRAVADNPDLAQLKGINPKLVSGMALALGAALAGVGGILLGMDTSIDPLTGYRVLLSVFAAAVLGGLGSIPGAVVGALAIGVAEEVSLLAVPATYRGAIAFFAILAMLTFRPRGLLGERST